MVLLNMKLFRIVLYCLMLFTFLMLSFGKEIPTTVPQPEETEPELDFEALLAAIKKADTSIKSGEGEFVYTNGHPPFDTYTWTFKGKIAFDLKKTRYDLPRRTTILTPTTMWEIVPFIKRAPNYHFSTKPQRFIHPAGADPRQWSFLGTSTQDSATYLRENSFEIIGREFFRDLLCYVLETKEEDKSTKIWIAPERGFRPIKRESKIPRPVDALDSDIPMEALTNNRTIIWYEQFGKIWFPKRVISESFWVDFKVEEPIFFRQTLETKNFKINHSIPAERFAVEIPDEAMIRVDGDKVLSKKEFLEQYEEQ